MINTSKLQKKKSNNIYCSNHDKLPQSFRKQRALTIWRFGSNTIGPKITNFIAQIRTGITATILFPQFDFEIVEGRIRCWWWNSEENGGELVKTWVMRYTTTPTPTQHFLIFITRKNKTYEMGSACCCIVAVYSLFFYLSCLNYF